jgi:thymidylate synthase
VQSFASIDFAQHWLLRSLLEAGKEVAPRNSATRELLSVQFTLANPRARRLGNRVRNWSFAAAVGEFAWHAGGVRDLSQLAYYFPRWAQLSDDAREIHGSCYGWRIFHPSSGGGSQWSRMLNLLRQDQSSRRAVLTLQDETRLLDHALKDSPCALALQFVVRERKLDAIGLMRSNDVIWGLPYDIFVFTMLQEVAATQLGLDLGVYTHFASSMHLYERHYELARRIIDGPITQDNAMDSMSSPEQLPIFLQHERAIRTGITRDAGLQEPDVYWQELIRALEEFAQQRAAKAS